jgi:hypothetical protein
MNEFHEQAVIHVLHVSTLECQMVDFFSNEFTRILLGSMSKIQNPRAKIVRIIGSDFCVVQL